MTNVLDGVAVSLLSEMLGDGTHDDSCVFCNKEGTKPDTPKETVYKGNSTTLRKNLGDLPSWSAQIVSRAGERPLGQISSRPNAHHLIPAEASLHGERSVEESAGSGDVLPEHNIMCYMSVNAEGSKVTEDIGYDVNQSHNGIWLPSIPPKGWTSYSDAEQLRIAGTFMHNLQLQWHQTHESYSQEVEKALTGFVEKLKGVMIPQCSLCKDGDKTKEPLPPPIGLVGRLRKLSNHLRGYLRGDRSKWKSPMFASTLARKYAEEPETP